MKIQDQLPEIYQQLLPKKWLTLDHSEGAANCSACSMSRKARGPRALVTYDENLKCCTFEPFLPNYIVGEILSNPLRYPQAKRVLEEKVSRRSFALPMGVVPTLKFQIQLNQKKINEFGQRKDWLCPYYDRKLNLCTIWRLRGAVCTSFYCRSDQGQKGLRYWDLVGDYLSYIEMSLAEEMLIERGFSPRQVSDQLEYFNRKQGSKREAAQTVLSASQWKNIWDGYQDPSEFYIECAGRIRAWSQKRVQDCVGEIGLELQKRLMQKWQEL